MRYLSRCGLKRSHRANVLQLHRFFAQKSTQTCFPHSQPARNQEQTRVEASPGAWCGCLVRILYYVERHTGHMKQSGPTFSAISVIQDGDDILRTYMDVSVRANKSWYIIQYFSGTHRVACFGAVCTWHKDGPVLLATRHCIFVSQPAFCKAVLVNMCRHTKPSQEVLRDGHVTNMEFCRSSNVQSYSN